MGRFGNVLLVNGEAELSLQARRGEVVRLHLTNRFLILSRVGRTEPNLVWKDPVLIPSGRTVDLLLELTHPGEWMAHCHIAEHHEDGMQFSFTVEGHTV